MIPENRIPTHPGIILLEEFLDPLGVTQVALASHLGIPTQRVNEIVRGKRGVTPATAWLLSQALGTTPQFWLNLQMNHDLALNKPTHSIELLPMIEKAAEGEEGNYSLNQNPVASVERLNQVLAMLGEATEGEVDEFLQYPDRVESNDLNDIKIRVMREKNDQND